MLHAPEHPIGHPDRSLDCQLALESGFLSLMHQAEAMVWTRAAVEDGIRVLAAGAVAAGWTAEEVGSALLSLAQDRIRSIDDFIGDEQWISDVRAAGRP